MPVPHGQLEKRARHAPAIATGPRPCSLQRLPHLRPLPVFFCLPRPRHQEVQMGELAAGNLRDLRQVGACVGGLAIS